MVGFIEGPELLGNDHYLVVGTKIAPKNKKKVRYTFPQYSRPLISGGVKNYRRP